MRFSYNRQLLSGIGLAIGLTVLSAGALRAQEATTEDKVVATINGENVTESELALVMSELEQQFAQLPPEQKRAAALSAIIEIRLLSAQAVTKGLDKDPEFQRRIAFLKQRALHSDLVTTEVADKITDAEIRAEYDRQISETPPVNEVHARHILVKTKEEALDVVKRLDAGEDFIKLANELTTDPSGKTTGGDLGYFAPGQMVPEFEKAAFSLDVGAYTKDPIETQFGWHVIKVEDKRAKQPPAFEQVKDQLKAKLFRDKYFALVKSVRDAATVEVTDEELKKRLAEIEGTQQ
jgi:peptidyl-prolyl cis-trans isomerase C